MGFNCGIVGLPNVGKSTLFNALTSAGAQVANYPFCTIDPNVGVVPVPDERMTRLTEMYRPQKVTPTTMEFVDIAGLVKGASQGEGLGNRFLSHIREVDAIVHVVRCFEDPDVTHVHAGVDPKRDIEIIETELALADLESIDKRLQKIERLAKSGDKKSKQEKDFLLRLQNRLTQGKSILGIAENDDEKAILHDCRLLTDKPVVYAANVAEEDVVKGNTYVRQVEEIAARKGAGVVTICGKIENELSALSMEEHRAFLQEMGLSEPGLYKLIRAGYGLLHLVTFFTAGEKEVRAWTIAAGTRAPQAAGKIHSDIEKGFIRAEVMTFDDLSALGSAAAVKEKGLLRLEGKDYVVQDGDVIYFRFNV